MRALRMPWSRSPAIDDARWVVVDVESSGLDPYHDRLLAVAGVAVHWVEGRPRIAAGDSFEVVLRQGAVAVDKSNILLHGIGVGEQRAGREPREALQAFLDWVGRAPLVAFHAGFDEAMLHRALSALGLRLAPPWLDLAPLAEVVQPGRKAKALDEWLALHGIVCAVRHQAAADTLATAELLLKLWQLAQARGERTDFKGLRALADQRRWLGPGD